MAPLSIASGDVSCAVVPFRYQKRLWTTVVVKARFAFVPGGIATHSGAAEIRSEERQFDGHPSRSIERASDLAPYLPRCDVTFVGHAYPPGGSPAPAMSARIGLARDGRPVLDKVVHVFGDRGPAGPKPFERMSLVYERAFGGPGEPNPVGKATPNLVDPADPRRPAGFAPISRLWLARRRLLGSADPRALEAPIADIPDAMPWGYFQAAPPDQLVDHLRGDEWLVLDGLHPTLPRVQTRLPSARGVARVIARSAGSPPVERPVEMVCDTLAIDGDRQEFALVWRGRVEVPGGEDALPSLVVAAALEVPGRDVDWARLWAQAPALSVSSSALATTSALESQGTVALRPEQQVTAAAKAVVPFPVVEAGGATVPWRFDATPWGGGPLSPPPAPAGETTLGPVTAKREEAGEGTLALWPELQAAVRPREVAPFPIVPAGTSGPVAPVPGAPWGPLTAPLQTPIAGEGTLSLGESVLPPVPPPIAASSPVVPPPIAAPPPAPPPMAAPPPLSPPIAAPPPVPPLMAFPSPIVAPPPGAHVPPSIASPRAASPAVVAQVRPPAPAAPPPSPVVPPPASGSPEALLAKLRAAGASERDVEALQRALKPPSPPPDDD
ncbi:DUF2169 domain-containing protein [Sorangium sp. So ce375]|uniref:DUF2169 family type VI secretion system accessory protein n=1 Tax=Sorangium sp. So ce375 TaxID=3133306 RepID=UPI003F5AFB15